MKWLKGLGSKKKYLIAGVLLLGFGAFSIHALSASMTPYVNFEEARGAADSVQVKGYLVEEDQVSYHPETNRLMFTMEDEEENFAQVEYEGTKPDNFLHAESLVVVGSFQSRSFQQQSGEAQNQDESSREEVFLAEDLLVECPSRYEEEAGDNSFEQ